MSEDFQRVARKEIISELDKLDKLIQRCSSDSHVLENCQDIKSHLHKIKGLAPMIGHLEVGEIARINDLIIQHILNHGLLPGALEIITKSIYDMISTFKDGTAYDLDEFKRWLTDKQPNLHI